MAIPANTTPNQNAQLLQNAFTGLKREAQSLIAECQTGSIKLGDLVNARLQAFINYKDKITLLASTQSIDSAYQALYPNNAFTFATEKDAILAASQTLIDFIVSQVPKNGVYISVLEFDTDYKLIQRTTNNAAAIASLQNITQSLVDLID